MKKCHVCNGTGKIVERIYDYKNEYSCDTCKSTGFISESKKK